MSGVHINRLQSVLNDADRLIVFAARKSDHVTHFMTPWSPCSGWKEAAVSTCVAFMIAPGVSCWLSSSDGWYRCSSTRSTDARSYVAHSFNSPFITWWWSGISSGCSPWSEYSPSFVWYRPTLYISIFCRNLKLFCSLAHFHQSHNFTNLVSLFSVIVSVFEQRKVLQSLHSFRMWCSTLTFGFGLQINECRLQIMPPVIIASELTTDLSPVCLICKCNVK